MSASIFDLKLVEPNDKMLSVELGRTYEYHEKIRAFIKDCYGDLTLEWKYYGQKSGWILKMFNKKRNVLFVIPCKDYFRIAFTLGDKAVDKLIASELPDFIKHDFVKAKKFSEGRTIQLEIKTEQQCECILELIKIKLSK
ncbi:MAG: DUF3788 family protein [Bacteroidales bacterium]|nr:MAG: DUF3788 family protein [Bacteroidales bacterium]